MDMEDGRPASATPPAVHTAPTPADAHRLPVPTSSDSQSEAGPSRPRRSSTSPHAGGLDGSEAPPPSDEPQVGSLPSPRIDLATYPTQTLLRLLAGLLSQIAAANDHLRQDVEMEDTGPPEVAGDMDTEQPPPPPPTFDGLALSFAAPQAFQAPSPTSELFADDSSAAKHITPDPDNLYTAARTSIVHPASLLAFHARHIPSITIESYLLRILKYCPTTNEVFISLLVYFDRMSRLGTPEGVGGTEVPLSGMGKGFAIDSYNVHRLVIAGVTVASKFFSDVFYTNSRYAKVGGLPSHELNQLELQFLLLNNFRLMVPPEEMQRYGDRLLGYWQGRESEVGVESVFPPAGTSPTSTDVKKTEAPPRSERAVRMQRPEKPARDEPDTAGSTSAESGSQPMAVDPSAPRASTSTEQFNASTPSIESRHPTTADAKSDSAPPSQTSSSPARVKAKTESSFSSTDSNPVRSVGASSRSGLGEWTRNEPILEVVGNRIASPMRD